MTDIFWWPVLIVLFVFLLGALFMTLYTLWVGHDNPMSTIRMALACAQTSALLTIAVALLLKV